MNNASIQPKRKNVRFVFYKPIVIKNGIAICQSSIFSIIDNEEVELHDFETKVRVIGTMGFITEFEKKHIKSITEGLVPIWDSKQQTIKTYEKRTD